MSPHVVTCQRITSSLPGLPNSLESVRLNIGFPVVRTDGRSVARSRDYQIFWNGQIALAMGLRPRVREELRHNQEW